MQNTSVSFKIFFQDNANIRRFRMDYRPTYEEFVAFMVKLYAPVYHPELRLQYVDSEGDNIDVTSQLEWEEMFKELRNEKIYKIKVVEGTRQYFKDGPEPVPVYAYDDPIQKKPLQYEDENFTILRSRVPRCLQELFHGKKILPHNLPSFLNGVVNIINHPNNVVDIDVDVTKLQIALSHKGYEYLENQEYEKGRTMYLALLLLVPEDPIGTYNLACAESLLGNREEAVKVLRRSVDLGYANLSHLVADEDLKNIRDMPEFGKIVTELKVRQTPTEVSYVTEMEPMKPESIPVQEPETIQEPETVQKPETEQKPETVQKPENVQEPKTIQEPVKEPEAVKEPEPVKHEPIYVPIPLTESPVSFGFNINPKFQKWERQLVILHDVGYFDDELLVSFLERTKGSVEQTVLALLDM
jgi:tetratricopeptide (TPR) repeat protein